MPVYTTFITRAAMAVLHCEPRFPMRVHAWRAYETDAGEGELLLFFQSSLTMRHLRDVFPLLPRLRVTTMDRLMLFLIDSPGLFGLCAFSGGHFTRALRRVNANLADRFEGVAPPAPPASPVRRVHEVLDLTLAPDTPDLISRSRPLSPA